jgi:hypothetical protein
MTPDEVKEIRKKALNHRHSVPPTPLAIIQLCEENLEMRTLVEYYARTDLSRAWLRHGEERLYINELDLELINDSEIGGKRAREFLKKHEVLK